MSRPGLQHYVGGRIPVDIRGVHEVELVSKLGEGGFGAVWKARDTASGTLYALKVIQNIKPGTIMAERVRREAAVSIPSDYVVASLGLREWDPGTFLILFELFEAKTLDDLIVEGRLTADQKRTIFGQVLEGVSDAHRNNIIHRDLKPGNILVATDFRTKVIDFGLSKFRDKGITVSGEIFGTPAYMPIEAFVEGSRMVDARADIYALGHILYELAMGNHFWVRRGWSELSDFFRYVTATPAPTEGIDLSDFKCDFYPGARTVVAKMVQIYAPLRYASVDQVRLDLGYSPFVPVAPPDLGLRFPMLIVESGTNQGGRTLVSLEDGEERTFGRLDLAADEASVSREHLIFRRQGDDYFVRETKLGSKNGTMVRGIALGPGDPEMELHHGDRILMGDLFLRFAFLS